MQAERLHISYCPYNLRFKEPGGTSRGVLREKLTYFLRIADCDNPDRIGYGEVPIFPGLSAETPQELEQALKELARGRTVPEEIPAISSLTFGLEQALAQLKAGDKPAWTSDFTEGKSSITINGLIWMGDAATMETRIKEKLDTGFICIKLKIGAIDWEEELRLIRQLRQTAGSELTIRVDANGAFSPKTCMRYLDELARLGVHSIEQPIRAGQPEKMRELCRATPIPIALDEELIGIPISSLRSELLDFIEPQYIILKPALCNGFGGSRDWIERAERRGTGWWITSALESSVGLDAIAQFTGTYNTTIPQGLGTGNLYSNNFDSPLRLEGERLRYTGEMNPRPYGLRLESLHWRTE